jgi:seryl-tRNA synthetase
MIDIKLLRENPQAIKDSIKRRGLKLDIDALLDLDTKRRAKIAELEGLQAKRNALASEVGKGKPTSEQVARGRELKSQHESIDGELKKLDLHFHELMAEVPNLIAEGTPDGGEESNKEIEKNGNTSKGFEVKDHMQLNELYGLYDFEAGAKVAGNKFYFTRHRAVKLWQSILMATQEIVEQEGFELVAVPHMVSTEVAEGTGYLPKGDEEQNYVDEKQGLVMIATSEIPLTGMHKDEILDLDEPLMYAGISPCYRLEAGAYGKFSKGLYRTHQFEKLEMYVFCKPEDSASKLQQILNIEKKICEQFEIPYRVVRIAAGDLSAPAFEKYDIEYYSPAEKEYRELTSCSNCTDYQARNLNIRYRDSSGIIQFAHTLNGTAVVSSRMPIAILENHQTKEGKIKLPSMIAKYYGSSEL